MSSNADKLKALRYTLGLTKTKTPAQSKIKAFLEVQDISPALIAESKKAIGLEERQKALQHHFY